MCALALVTPVLPDSDGPLDPLAALARGPGHTFVIQAAADRVVPRGDAQQYVEAIEAAGHAVEHVLVPLADHAFSADDLRAVCLDRLRDFFDRMTPVPPSASASA